MLENHNYVIQILVIYLFILWHVYMYLLPSRGSWVCGDQTQVVRLEVCHRREFIPGIRNVVKDSSQLGRPQALGVGGGSGGPDTIYCFAKWGCRPFVFVCIYVCMCTHIWISAALNVGQISLCVVQR